MSTNINLLLPKDGESLKRKMKVRAFNIAAIISVFATGLMSIVVFLLIQAVSPVSVEREQEDVLRKLSQFQDRQAKLLIVNKKIEDISEILENRKDLRLVTGVLLSKVPSNLSIDSLEIDSKNVSITAQSASLFSIGELINNLTDMVRKKEILSSLTLNSLTFNEARKNYQLTIKSEL